jgi:NAD-dependent SIR2 family protein deacetylase
LTLEQNLSPLDTRVSTRRILKMRVLVITGAGVSVGSGIPTFRGKDGYWRNLDPAKLATPEAFVRDPELVWEWYHERRQRIRNAQPNAAHLAIVKLAQHADEFLLITQNVDDLHARAGIPKEKVVQIHGDIFVTRCSRCNFHEDRGGLPRGIVCAAPWFIPRGEPEPPASRSQQAIEVNRSYFMAADQEENKIPRCPECDALMRPGVVWFGEQLPLSELKRVENYLDRGPCDFVIVAGTTATFGYIVDWALRASPESIRGELIEVNPEETPLSQFATTIVRETAARALPKLVDQFISRMKL